MSLTNQEGVSPGEGVTLSAGMAGSAGGGAGTPAASFYTFDGTEDGISLPDVALTGDFSLIITLDPVDITNPPDISGMITFGDMANLTWVRIEPDGKIRFKIAGFTETSAIGTYPLDNLQHTLKMTRVGALASYIVDDVTLDTDALSGTALDPVIFNTLGIKATNSQFHGILKDANIIGTQTGTATPLDLLWRIQDGWAANPTIAESNVGGGTWDGTALLFKEVNWS